MVAAGPWTMRAANHQAAPHGTRPTTRGHADPVVRGVVVLVAGDPRNLYTNLDDTGVVEVEVGETFHLDTFRT